MTLTSLNKLGYTLILFLLFAGCSAPDAKTAGKELELKVSAESQLGIGYGIIYSCEVKSVEKGALSDKEISLVLIKSRFYEVMDRKGMSPGTCTFTFKRSGKNKDDNYPAANGFIAKDRTVWEVVAMK
jgi:hypothetical protein